MRSIAIAPLVAGMIVVGLVLGTHASRQQPTASDAVHVMLTPAEMKWGDAPSSLPPGAKAAVIEGDPAKAGPFALRIQVPANYRIPPHWHPAVEHVTVLSGAFHVGMGDKMDESKAKALTQGSFMAMPPKTNHFAFTKIATEIQLHGTGPWGITYVNPADDPRKK